MGNRKREAMEGQPQSHMALGVTQDHENAGLGLPGLKASRAEPDFSSLKAAAPSVLNCLSHFAG